MVRFTYSIPIIYLMCLGGAFAQRTGEKITYNSQKGIYKVLYWSFADSTFYSVPLFPGDKHIPEIDAYVIAGNNGKFIYKYFLSNSKNSLREIYIFSILVRTKVSKVQIPNKQWKGSYVNWMKKVRWIQSNSKSDTLGILPGEEANGIFVFKNNNYPSITTAFTGSYSGLGNTVDEGPNGKILSKINSILEETKYVEVKTIGPQKIPVEISNTAFLDTLQNYLTFSCDTTWITNRGICRSLQAKLDNVEKQLSKDKLKQAINGLRAFLNEVQAQKGKHLSSEAYALLYYNGKFLKGKLEKKVGGRR